MTTFELPGCEDMWTVIGTLNNDEQIRPEAEGSHAFLILSQEDSTMVLCVYIIIIFLSLIVYILFNIIKHMLFNIKIYLDITNWSGN